MAYLDRSFRLLRVCDELRPAHLECFEPSESVRDTREPAGKNIHLIGL